MLVKQILKKVNDKVNGCCVVASYAQHKALVHDSLLTCKH